MANNIKLTTNLFGMPYQFPDKVDPRVKSMSSVLGKEYLNNMMLEAPICTFVPGEPSYLSAKKDSVKRDTALAMLNENGNFTNSDLNSLLGDKTLDSMRLYDFKTNYTDYIKYVNSLCRAGAVFLEISNVKLTVGNYTKELGKFDWSHYKFSAEGQASTLSRLTRATKYAFQFKDDNDTANNKNKKNEPIKAESNSNDDFDDLLSAKKFVQFYVDADVSSNESMSNNSQESQMKSLFDTGSSTIKELAFMANSGIGEDALNFAQNSADALTSGVNQILDKGNGAVTGVFQRILNLGKEVLKGSNLVIPDVYQSSEYSKSYSITIHLKSPYGSKIGYYLNIFVPLMHLIALCLPRQSTSQNSYDTPFIVKAYVDGIFSCNMGLVSGLSIQRSAESWSVDGLPTEVDVTIDLKDLYSNLSMTPSSAPRLFVHNSSLVEYLAVNCGLDLTVPNVSKKIGLVVGSLWNSVTDVPNTIKSSISENINRRIENMLKLYN